MTDWTFKKGDTGEPLRATLKDEDGTVDLSQASKVEIFMQDRDGTQIIDSGSATITDGLNGKIKYEWDSSDVSSVGIFKVEAKVTKGDGTEITFPNDGYRTITIDEDLEG